MTLTHDSLLSSNQDKGNVLSMIMLKMSHHTFFLHLAFPCFRLGCHFNTSKETNIAWLLLSCLFIKICPGINQEDHQRWHKSDILEIHKKCFSQIQFDLCRILICTTNAVNFEFACVARWIHLYVALNKYMLKIKCLSGVVLACCIICSFH